jgi:dimethylhistidine N-methyltransferase
MEAALGPRCAVVEPGAGSGVKTHMLLEALEDPVAYIPLDISRKFLLQTATALAKDFPQLEVAPICADYFSDWELPPLERFARRNAVFFPGSTIGNMEPAEAQELLRKLVDVCRSSRQRVQSKMAAIKGQGPVQPTEVSLLVGVDLRKDPEIIAAAYNDAEGVTREFNLNLITRMNRELGTDIPERAVSHYTHYDELAGRNESFVLIREPLRFEIAGQRFELAPGERIRVERSYKYDLDQFAELAAGAGLQVEQVWTDEQRWFSVQYLTTGSL